MSTPKAFDASGIQFAWDSTSIKLAETCLRKYEYRMIHGWTREDKSVHLLFGGWYAAALERYYKLRAEGMSYDDATNEVVSQALYETWHYDEEGQSIGPWVSDHNTKTRENLIRTIVWYLDQFGDEDTMRTVINSEGTPLVEHTFALDADNGIILSGHLDRVVEYAGHPYVQDQKTTGSTITARFFDQFSPDTQMSLYTFAGQAIFGIPVKGVVIDGAQIAVGFTRFERGFTFRTEPQLNEWYDGAMRTIELAQRATRENYFPMNPSSCNNFGGCEFRGICSRSPEVRDNFLRADFVRGERWDPLKAR